MPDFPVLSGLGSDTYPTVYQPSLKLLSFCKLKMYLVNNTYTVFLLFFFFFCERSCCSVHFIIKPLTSNAESLTISWSELLCFSWYLLLAAVLPLHLHTLKSPVMIQFYVGETDDVLHKLTFMCYRNNLFQQGKHCLEGLLEKTPHEEC